MYLEQELPTHTRTRSLKIHTISAARPCQCSLHRYPPPPPSILINHKNMKFILEQVVPFKIKIFGIKRTKVWIWAIINEQRLLKGILSELLTLKT